MKQFSIALNVALLVAVGFLYYLHFSGEKKYSNGSAPCGSSSKDVVCGLKKPVIAYVELDSLNNNVAYIKARKTELETEQKGIQANYENAYRSLEAEKNNFLKKGNAITQQEAEVFQEHLGQEQQQIEAAKQQQSQALAEKGAKIMERMQTKLKDFLNDYNKDKKYTYILATGTGLDYIFYKDSTLNITPEIVKGLNDKMNADSK